MDSELTRRCILKIATKSTYPIITPNSIFRAMFVGSVCVGENGSVHVCGLQMTLHEQEIISWEFQTNRTFHFHFADGFNTAWNAKSHVYYCFDCFASMFVVSICVDENSFDHVCGCKCLYISRRSLPESFRKMTIFIVTLQMTPTWARWDSNVTLQQGHVGAISKVKNKFSIFLKLWRNDLLCA